MTLLLTGAGACAGACAGAGVSSVVVFFVGSLDNGPVIPMQFNFVPKKATCFFSSPSSNTVTLSSHPRTFVLVTVP